MAYDNLTQTIMKFCDNAEKKFKIDTDVEMDIDTLQNITQP